MQVLGHRGWPRPSSVENTLASVVAALSSGADGVEVDVRLTADGVAVCAHDDDLTRVGGAVRSIRATRWSDLQQVRLPDGSPVPRLLDVAAVTAGRGLLVLDFKPDPRTGSLLRAALADVQLSGMAEPDVVASSFDGRLLDVLAVRRPGLSRAAILDVGAPLEPALRTARRRRDAALHLPLRTVLSSSCAVRDAGLPVRVWTVNRVVDARLCELLGVHGLITDEPAALTVALRPVAA